MMTLASLLLSITTAVNVFIGTTNFGACNPGAVTPNGMMSVSPFNVMGSSLNVWDKDSRWWSTPYVEENSYFTGFSHVNLSGVGCPELGSLLVMPTVGQLDVDYHHYCQSYSSESAVPGYYKVELDSGVTAEASATARSSVERYTFPGGRGNIILNLGEGLTNESGAWLRQVSDTEVEGSKLMGTFCYNSQAVFPIYFVLRVNKTPSGCGFFKKQRPMTAEAAWDDYAGKYKIYSSYHRDMAGDDIGFFFSWDSLAEGEQVLVSMGVSFVSVENARLNLESEQPLADFEKVRSDADRLWEEHLGRIRISGGTQDQRTVFYTAFYHALIHPNVLNDVNGEYPLMEFGDGSDGGVGKVAPGHNRYTVFSLWDTCRNVHQLMTLLFPDKQTDMVRSAIDMYREWGWMPKWELYGRETFTMEGDPAIPMITDSWLKGIRDIDIDTAYEAFIKSADTPGDSNRMRPDCDPYNERGYIPVGWFAADFSGDNSVSHALEYYMADNALSKLAAALADECSDKEKADAYRADSERFRARSLGYRNYYSAEYGCLRPLEKDGSFLTPFNPRQGENFEQVPGFHEGSAWNYTFYVPHDVDGLVKLMGGGKAFVARLQKVFDDELYDPANEPDIAYPYLFSRVKGNESRTWKTVEAILSKYYMNRFDGIPGNDDTGTMSAWAVFSMLGFYPDCPGEPYYTLTRPTFDKAEISLPDGRVLNIVKDSAKATKAYAASRRRTDMRISHSDFVKAGTIRWKK